MREYYQIPKKQTKEGVKIALENSIKHIHKAVLFVLNVKKTYLGYPLATIFLLFGGTLFIDAYAYIDPGSGSMFIQVIVGALVGVGIAIKVYWEKIKFKLSMMKSSKSQDD